ncbi:MAG: hypothetical protein LBR08_07545 [Bacteroidales bacterium]|jgi:IS30 family transposase|nr:hypothetical protein [Bacteroidales bacterium]
MQEGVTRSHKFTESVGNRVMRRLTREQRSPEQMVGKAGKDGMLMVGHERICQFIREDKGKAGTLYKHPGHGLKHRNKICRRIAGKGTQRIYQQIGQTTQSLENSFLIILLMMK